MRWVLAWILSCAPVSEPRASESVGDELGSADEADAEDGSDDRPDADARLRTHTCPRRSLTAPDTDVDEQPRFDHALWLDFAISMADVVVEGSIDGSSVRAAVLCGEATPEMTIHPIQRELRGEGVWLLVRSPNGHVVLNPDREPLERSQWDLLVARSEPRDSESTDEHVSSTQIYRTLRADRSVWHGVEVAHSGSDVHVVLHERGETRARIAFDANGLERVVLQPASGRGFMLQNARGSLWRYEHYVDGRLEGTARTFERGTTQLRDEAHYRGGRMHGRVRHWEDGRVVRDVTYQDGLIAPVVPWSGAPGAAQIHYGSEGSVSYSAPRDVMDGIRVGMHAREVARLLQLPVSPAMGIRFPGYRCEEALTIRFRGQRVSERELLPNGAHCM